jgi:hypothetical protein
MKLKQVLFAALFSCLGLSGLSILPDVAVAAPVWIDEDTVTDPFGAPNVSSLTVSVTVSAGANTSLFFATSTRSASVTVLSCSFNTTEAATFIKSELNGSLREEVWRLPAPTATTANAVCTFSGPVSNGSRLSVHQWDGVGGVGASNNITGTSATPSISLTSTVTDSVVFANIFDGVQTASPFTPSAGTTERVDGTTSTTVSDASFTDLEKATTVPGIYTASTVASVSGAWAAVAVEILPVSVGGTGPGNLALTGVGISGGGAPPPPPPPECSIDMAPGSTDAQIIAQFAAAPDGSEVCLALNQTVIVSNVIQMDVSQRALSLNCRGSTLQRNHPGNVVWAQGAEVGTSPVTHNTVGNVTTLTWPALPVGLQPLDWIKFTSDDPLTGSAGASAALRPRNGQAMQVGSMGALTTTLLGVLNYDNAYTTNRRANKIQSKPPKIKNCRILGNAAQPTWQQPSIQFTNVITPIAEQIKCEAGLAGCINVTNTVSAVIRDIDCRTLTAGSLGVNNCVNSNASWNTQVSGVYAQATRKPVEASSNDIAAASISLAEYGGVWNISESDVVCYLNNGPDGCYGFKSEAQNTLTERGSAFSSPKFASSSGINNTIRNSFGLGGVNGIELVDQVGGVGLSGDDGIDLEFDDVIIRELTGVGLTAVNAPQQNRLCRSLIETSGATVESVTDSINYASCDYISGQMTYFNSTLAANVTNTQDNFACQTCGDMIIAGAGNDIINALAGDDFVLGGTGNDTISLGGGRDTLAYWWTDEGSDTVSDFTVGVGGDIIDVSRFVARAVGGNYIGDPLADGYVVVTQSGGNTLLKLDDDGSAGPNAAVTVATLTGVTAANLVGTNWKLLLR